MTSQTLAVPLISRDGYRPGGPFEHLFLTEYARVVGIAYRVVADRDEAEDVAQEVFWRFHRRYPDGREAAMGWLHAAAVHTALNSIRTRKRRVVRELTHFADQALTGAQGGPDPAQLAEQDERREQLRAAMGRIPKKSAWVLALRYGGLSYQEVADALGVGIGQVGTLLRRAEITLRKEVQSGTSQ